MLLLLGGGKQPINPSVFLLCYILYMCTSDRILNAFSCSLKFIARLHCVLRQRWAGPKDSPSLGSSPLKGCAAVPKGLQVFKLLEGRPCELLPKCWRMSSASIPQLLWESKRVWEILLSAVSGDRFCAVIKCNAAPLGSGSVLELFVLGSPQIKKM